MHRSKEWRDSFSENEQVGFVVRTEAVKDRFDLSLCSCASFGDGSDVVFEELLRLSWHRTMQSEADRMHVQPSYARSVAG